MASSTLPISIIADVTVVTSSPQAAAPTFNIGLVVGPTPVIPTVGANSRVRKYLATTYASAMLTDGFTAGDPEYICAQMYFSQSPQPSAIQIGRQDGTALKTVVPSAGSPGTDYKVGDMVNVSQAGATNGILRVATVGPLGDVMSLTVYSAGTAYHTAIGAVTTTDGDGVDLTVDITAIGESALIAFQQCRAVSSDWYAGMVAGAKDADHVEIAAWTASQVGTMYFGTTDSPDARDGVIPNVLHTIYGTSNKRCWMQYATTQGVLAPNQIYFVASVIGQAMASNTQLANSSYTMKFSGGVPLVGVYTEPGLTIGQIQNIEGQVPSQGPNGNLFLNYGNAYNVLEQGTMMSEGVFFDQVMGLDILAANIQTEIMNVLTSVPKVPQTDSGQQMLIQAVERAANQAANTGFIAPGTWRGQNIIGQVTTGQTFPTGYTAVSPLYKTLSPAQIAARVAPPIYLAIIQAGAVHFVTVEVLVQV